MLTPSLIRAALENWEDPDNVYRQLGTNIRFYTTEDVGKACEALAALCSTECIVEPASMPEALQKSGLLDIPFHLRMVLMALIGEQFLAAFWNGIRFATFQTASGEWETCQYDPEALTAVAQGMVNLMKMPRWKRNLYIRWHAARKYLINLLRGERS